MILNSRLQAQLEIKPDMCNYVDAHHKSEQNQIQSTYHLPKKCSSDIKILLVCGHFSGDGKTRMLLAYLIDKQLGTCSPSHAIAFRISTATNLNEMVYVFPGNTNSCLIIFLMPKPNIYIFVLKKQSLNFLSNLANL